MTEAMTANPPADTRAPAAPAHDEGTLTRAAWYRHVLPLCHEAIAGAGKKRAWLRVDIRGHRAGPSIEVYPEVRGWLLGHGTRASLNIAGGMEKYPYTSVKVCARTLLSVVERGVATLPADLRP